VKNFGECGIYHFLATSENEVLENPRWYRVKQQKLRDKKTTLGALLRQTILASRLRRRVESPATPIYPPGCCVGAQ